MIGVAATGLPVIQSLPFQYWYLARLFTSSTDTRDR